MKANLIGILSLGLLVSLLGCARERENVKAPNPRTTAFSQAGVSLVLGEEWQASNLTPAHSLQPPTLVSQAGVIRVMLLPVDCADPEVVANGLRAAFEANPKAAKHSFRRQHFASKTGVQGVCISYLQTIDKDGHVSEVQNNHYVIKNAAARCVAINYMAAADADPDPVSRTIRNTLALQ